jgi:hypothetical protein
MDSYCKVSGSIPDDFVTELAPDLNFSYSFFWYRTLIAILLITSHWYITAFWCAGSFDHAAHYQILDVKLGSGDSSLICHVAGHTERKLCLS